MSHDNLDAPEYDEELTLPGIVYFADEVDLIRLKNEFVNLHSHCKKEACVSAP